MDKSHVTAALSPGSVKVDVEIQVPRQSMLPSVKDALADMAKQVTDVAKAIPAVAKASDGVISTTKPVFSDQEKVRDFRHELWLRMPPPPPCGLVGVVIC